MNIKIFPKGSGEQLSANFKAYEFDCPCDNCTQTKIDLDLVQILQKNRDHFGKPIGGDRLNPYRCPTHNAEIKNASKTSLHMQGMAADFSIPGAKPLEVAAFNESIGVKGIGLYDDFVHVDTRPNKAFWYSHKQIPRTTFGGATATTGGKYSLEQFIRDVQTVTGAAVDGIAGPETLSKTVTLSAVENPTHAAVAPVQRRLLAMGYDEVGDDDGVAGPKFTAALEHLQRDHGCVEDGEATKGKKTWRVLLGMD
jgi:peptidoglycan hydrolase-like protein with peptidoglycan-binding domain